LDHIGRGKTHCADVDHASTGRADIDLIAQVIGKQVIVGYDS
jgi:hypothetical protein